MKVIHISAVSDVTIRAGRLFDGRSLIEEQTDIVVTGGLIRELKPCALHRDNSGEGENILNLGELTVLPGLVDCHAHLALDGKDFQGALDLWTNKELLGQRIREDLMKTLQRGIVAVRDGGDREWIGLKVRDEVNRGEMDGPRIRAAGIALGGRGKYGSFLGPGVAGEKIRETVTEVAGRGVDHIKVLVSGVVSFKNYRRVGDLQFTRHQLQELVSAAHWHGLRVMAHASSDQAVRMAVEAGADSLEHGYFISQSTLELMAGKGIPWIPTLAPVANQVRGNLRTRHSQEELQVIERTYLLQQQMVKKAADMGVPLGIGTDSGATGVLHGQGFLEEMLLLEEAGLSRDQVLQAATRGGSIILGLDKDMGVVKPGMPPCLIAVKGNPLNDLNALKNIEFMLMPRWG